MTGQVADYGEGAGGEGGGGEGGAGVEGASSATSTKCHPDLPPMSWYVRA
jgi:hypothetical protein